MRDDLDRFLEHGVWRDTRLARLVPLADAAETLAFDSGATLFRRFHPADRFFVLADGAVAHETDGDGAAATGEGASLGDVDWTWAALGWSGFLTPNRYGTTARAIGPTRVLGWRHEDLATCFYADPALAVDFFRLVIDSVRRQYEAVRAGRVASAGGRRPPAVPVPTPEVRSGTGFVAGTVATLRRSAFFERFDDAALEALAGDASLTHYDPGAVLVDQGRETAGLHVLARGTALSYFDDGTGTAAPIRFRTLGGAGAVVAGVATDAGGYVAEARVVAAAACSVYRISDGSIEALMRADPEFGRNYMQRSLARLANLLASARVAGAGSGDEPEIAAVDALLEQTRARIPVNSELNKVPHLLRHRLTVGNAFAALNTVAETGRYQERSIARTCRDLLSGLRAEHHFYRDVLDAYVDVVEAPGDVAPERLRERCDRGLAKAFGHLSTEVVGSAHLPGAGGNIVIMNHLSCPEDYELPNGYHFSFDTAFTSVLLNRRYGHSPVRIVRQSPGVEYGHNLFYSRLGHITVPTIESGIGEESAESLAELRKASARRLFEAGTECLGRGGNLLVCPEGQSQQAADSPGRFFSGAFRLALAVEPEPFVVPVALAGFDRRYRDSKLVAVVGKPFKLSEAMQRTGCTDLRRFLDGYRREFAVSVREAQTLSARDPTARVA